MKTLDEVIAELEDEGLFVDALHCLQEYRMLKDDIAEKRKTLEEKISHYCDLIKIETDHYARSKVRWAEEYKNIKDDYEALQNFWAEQQANPPLTFEELKAMQGKPVWVEYDPKRFPALDSCWGIATTSFTSWEGSECWTLVRPGAEYVTPVAEYGKTWKAYRKER